MLVPRSRPVLLPTSGEDMIPNPTSPVIIPSTLLIALAAGLTCIEAAEPDRNTEFFRERIEPVLIKHCYECHSSAAKELAGSLRLDSKAKILLGGDTGPAVDSGNAAASLLIKALRYQDLEMPPDGPLSNSIINDFEQWISSGAAMFRKTPTGPKRYRA